jgi:hypothetical protein
MARFFRGNECKIEQFEVTFSPDVTGHSGSFETGTIGDTAWAFD